MASLRKFGKKWYARVRTWDGKHQSEKLIPLRTESKVEARERLSQVNREEANIKAGMDFSFPWLNQEGITKVVHKTLQETANEFIRSRRVYGLAENTIARNINSLNALMKVVGKSYPIKRFTTKQIDEFVEYYQGKHSGNGININLRLIKTFLRWCGEKKLLIEVPKVAMVKTPNPLPCCLTDSVFAELMELESLDAHYKSAFKFYRETGLRLSEPFYGIIDGNWLVLPAEFTKQKTEREKYLSDELCKICNEIQLRFQTRKGEAKWFIQRYSREFKRACREIGVEHHFHDLRHTFAVRRWLETGDILLVKEEMGHASVKTTEIYTKFSLRRLEHDFPSLSRHYEKRQNHQEMAIRDTDYRDTEVAQLTV